jgi:hypothetical protein
VYYIVTSMSAFGSAERRSLRDSDEVGCQTTSVQIPLPFFFTTESTRYAHAVFFLLRRAVLVIVRPSYGGVTTRAPSLSIQFFRVDLTF